MPLETRKITGINGAGAPVKILIAEDVEASRRLITGFLSRFDFDIRQTGNGQECEYIQNVQASPDIHGYTHAYHEWIRGNKNYP